MIEPMQGTPRDAARENKRAAPNRGGPPKKPYRPKRGRPT